MAKTLGDITTELTEKVLSPAKAEAEKIISDARSESEKIIADAESDVRKLKERAEKQVEDTRKQMDADLGIAARNFIIKVQEKLENSIVEPVVKDEIKSTLDDKKFMEKIIETLIAEFGKYSGKEHRIEILLPEDKKSQLQDWFLERFRQKVISDVIVHFTDKISFGLKIGSEGKGSHFNFSEGLVEVFSEFCSPRFRQYFFAKEEEK
jgi:V/A-type H+-transporting ATPase subunit E